jgi:hypothetical protein
VSLLFFIELTFRPHYGPGVHSGSNTKEYQVQLFGGGVQMRPVRRADNHSTFMCQLSSNSGSLSFLEPSGTAQLLWCILYISCYLHNGEQWSPCTAPSRWLLCCLTF